MPMPDIKDAEFARFQRFILDAAGITLPASKKSLVAGRLAKRLRHHGLSDYGQYLRLLEADDGAAEVQTAVDLLTTNETYFFREMKHFALLREVALSAKAERRLLRVWSAACSSGEEVYSIAMVLDDVLGAGGFEVLGTDLSTRVLQTARTGHFSEERAQHIPPAYRQRYCLRGMGSQSGTMLVERSLRAQVRFAQVNLNAALPSLGSFDMIFLRNVLIYFNIQTKREVVARVLQPLKPGGHFCIGHSETLNDVSQAVQQIAPSVYRKP